MLKPELQAKFLQNLNRKKKDDEGFTLIELLVVVIIIGVLAAIALPSLLNQVSKARQSEAKQNIGSINRAQQAYYLENSNKFATGLQDLGIGIKEKTDNYEYAIDTDKTGQWSLNKAAARAGKLKSYAGITYTITQQVNKVDESLTQAALCESESPFDGKIAVQKLSGGDEKGDCSKVTPKMKVIK